jgi:hypothetical protein
MMGAAGAAGEKVYVEDVFSTYLYTGNGSTQTITNDIDLAGEGGLVWIKNRSGTGGHRLFDTARGVYNWLASNSTGAQQDASPHGVTAFNSNGFAVSDSGPYAVNDSGATYASWTFRKAPRFFDVVTYTGNGGTQVINHNLGCTVGTIICKETTHVEPWLVEHRDIPNKVLYLDDTSQALNGDYFTSTDTSITVNTAANVSGHGYVMYLFAHDPLGPSGDGSDGLIACGSFNTGGSGTGPVELGFEPQFCILKASSTAGNWVMSDVMRGASVNTTNNRQYLLANSSGAESSSEGFYPTATGFVYQGLPTSTDYIYIAIRRGPMKVPTDGTEVFAIDRANLDGSPTNPQFFAGFPIDFAFIKDTVGGSAAAGSRLIQGKRLYLNLTDAEETYSANNFASMTSWLLTQKSNITYSWMFRRAPGFFDVVAYTGTGTARTVAHNLTVAPELMIVKIRAGDNDSWVVWNTTIAAISSDSYLTISTPARGTSGSRFNSTAPTSSVFTVGTDGSVNGNTWSYVAYLFASCPGVSKVGSYTGTGTTLSIDCGFTAGARFVLIKRTDASGDWYFWDTARGISAGNDPYLLLNSVAAEVTNTDYIDPLSSGFQISSTAPAAINASGGTYIFLAIA